MAEKTTKRNKWKSLCLSLKYRPKIMQLILKMRQVIRRRNAEIKSLKHRLKREDKSKRADVVLVLPKDEPENSNITFSIDKSKSFNDASTQTRENQNLEKPKKSKKNIHSSHENEVKTETKDNRVETDSGTKDTGWKSGENEKSIAEQVKEAALNALNDFEKKAGWDVNGGGDNEKSIAEQVKEVAQTALQQTGMVYIESAGMYYDYKTGYYYNSELGLYYHTETNCYYYLDEKQQFVFHSYPDTSAVNANLIAHQKKKARKQLKRERKPEDDIDNLTQSLSQDNEDSKTKRRKTKKSKKNGLLPKTDKVENQKDKKEQDDPKDPHESKDLDQSKNTLVKVVDIENNDVKSETENEVKNEKIGEGNEEGIKSEDIKMEIPAELEDGECSDSPNEEEKEEEDDDDNDSSSIASTATVSDEDSVAKHHPPCMRVIVRETDLPKLKVGSLYLITKDGGTVGREGEQHTILIKDHNVSRNHLDVKYDMHRRTYVVTDLGSKNGTILNGNRMSESSEISLPMDILHGSTIQLGETKLLCHIHPGNDTCGHCEPGLLMESEEKEKKAAYTRTCSVKKQHELELARLKNIYAPKLLEIEEKPYNDRAQARRETVGSSHHSVKTESTDLDTSISTENKGFKLLQKMGWSEGEGLGKDCQGNVEPVPLVSNDGKAGLGTHGAVSAPTPVPKFRPKNTIGSATLRLASRTKMLQPPAKAFQGDAEEDSE